MTLDLLDALEIVDDDVTAVVNAYMADSGCRSITRQRPEDFSSGRVSTKAAR
jgi:hypothetical protein